MTVWDAVFAALADQYHHPDKRGGGMIGKTTAVIEALGLTGDEPVDDIRRLRKDVA